MSERLTGGRAGESYRAVLTYLNGESEPSLDWLRKAADVLGVRFSWLVSGEGGRSAQEDRLTELVLGRVPHLYVHRPAVRAAFIETLRRILQTHPNEGGDLTDAAIEELASRIWVVVNNVQMKVATMVGRRESISDADAYGLAMLQAIMAAIGRAPAHGESVLAPKED